MAAKRKTVLFLAILTAAYLAAPVGVSACESPRKLPPGVVPGDGKRLIEPRSFIDQPQGGPHALVGFIVRHGDVVDAVTPIYRTVENDGSLGREVVTKRYGGPGGGQTVLKKEGYYVSEIRIKRGMWFNRPEVLWIQVEWKAWPGNGLADDVVLSKRLGTGNHADLSQDEIMLRAGANKFIAALKGMTSQHTSGETVLHQLAIHATRPIPAN